MEVYLIINVKKSSLKSKKSEVSNNKYSVYKIEITENCKNNNFFAKLAKAAFSYNRVIFFQFINYLHSTFVPGGDN